MPQKVSDEEVDKLKAAIRSRNTHKRLIDRDILIIELGWSKSLRKAYIDTTPAFKTCAHTL